MIQLISVIYPTLAHVEKSGYPYHDKQIDSLQMSFYQDLHKIHPAENYLSPTPLQKPFPG